MSNRKFTPPTEFPTQYVDGCGHKITLVGRGKGKDPLIGQDSGGNWRSYTETGFIYSGGMPADFNALHDLPKTNAAQSY